MFILHTTSSPPSRTEKTAATNTHKSRQHTHTYFLCIDSLTAPLQHCTRAHQRRTKIGDNSEKESRKTQGKREEWHSIKKTKEERKKGSGERKYKSAFGGGKDV